MNEQQPGNVISPRGQDPVPPSQTIAIQTPNTNTAPSSAVIPSTSQTVHPTLSELEQKYAPSKQLRVPSPYNQTPVADANAYQPVKASGESSSTRITWTASEFIDHAKSLNWYLIVGIVGLLGSIGVYFLTKDIISTVAIAVVAVLFAVSAARKPQVLPYTVNETGIQIGPKHYPYADFKTFSLIHDSSAFSSIHLMPLKRFAPPVTMYFPPDEEDSIANALSNYLPYEDRKADATDRLLKKLRF